MWDQAEPGSWGDEQGLWPRETVARCRWVQLLCKRFVLRTAAEAGTTVVGQALRLGGLGSAPQLEGCGVGVGGPADGPRLRSAGGGRALAPHGAPLRVRG